MLVASFWDGLSTLISLELLLNLLLDLDIIETSLLLFGYSELSFDLDLRLNLLIGVSTKLIWCIKINTRELTNISKIFIISDFRNQYLVQFFHYFLCEISKYFVFNFFLCVHLHFTNYYSKYKKNYELWAGRLLILESSLNI